VLLIVGVFTALLSGFELLPLALDPGTVLADFKRLLLPLLLVLMLLLFEDNLVFFVSSTSPRILLGLRNCNVCVRGRP